jgi:hypothetical protein
MESFNRQSRSRRASSEADSSAAPPSYNLVSRSTVTYKIVHWPKEKLWAVLTYLFIYNMRRAVIVSNGIRGAGAEWN